MCGMTIGRIEKEMYSFMNSVGIAPTIDKVERIDLIDLEIL